MEKKITTTLVIIYQCLSKLNNDTQLLGISVYNGYDDGSLDSVNYSLRNSVIDFSKIGDLVYLGNTYGMNIRLRAVENDVELFMTGEDAQNLREGMQVFHLNTSRDKIAADPDEILRCLPDTDLIKTYVGGIKEIISRWCVGNSDMSVLSSYKDLDKMIASQYAENHNVPYIPLYEEESSDEDKARQEEEARLAEEKQKAEIEKYSSFPVEMELMLNATVVPGMPTLNRINIFSGEETLRSLREYISNCKVCSVKYFGSDKKYVEDGELKESESSVIVNVDGTLIPFEDLDTLRDYDRENSELENKLKELEAEEERRIQEEQKRLEEERRLREEEEKRQKEEEERIERERLETEKQRQAEETKVEVEPEEVESLPMDIGLSAEDIDREFSEWESKQKELFSKYTPVSNSYGNPSEWKSAYSEYRKTLEELDNDNDYILVMCKSSYSSNPIITGLLKRTQVEVPKVEDDDDEDVNYESKIEFYDEFDLLSNSITMLSNLGVDFNLELLVVPSKFTFKYPVTPLLEICATPDQIPGSLPVIFINEERQSITKELVAKDLGYPDLFNPAVSEFVMKDLEESEYETICKYIESMCRAVSLEERLNLRVFHFNDTIVYKLSENFQADSIIGEYNSQQEAEYFNFNEAVKRSDGKVSPINSNYVLPQMINDEKYFSLLKSYSETLYLKESIESDFVVAQVPNLKNLITGVSTDYPYFNSSNYQENFKVERDYYKSKGMKKEEIDEIIAEHTLSVVGSVANSKEPIKEWEKPFFNYLKNLIDCELICENDIKTNVQLKELVKNGVSANNVNQVIREWCKAAYALNYMHTNYIAEEEVILSLGYNRDGISPANYCEYNVIKVGTDRNVSLKTDWGDKAREADSSKKIDGFYALATYVEAHQSTYCWAEVLVRLLRWGSRKQKFLKLDNDDMVFDFSQAQVVEEYEDVTAKSMTNRELVLNQILAGRYKVESLDAKNLGSEFDKYMRGAIVGSRQQNFKSVYASLMVSLGRNDGTNWEQIYVDTLSFVKSLYKNNGRLEIKGVDGEWSINDCSGISYDESKGRITIDTDVCGVFDEQTSTTSPKVQVRNEQTLGVNIKEYEQINKNALETYVGATDNVIMSDLPIDGNYILHKMQIRTLDKECSEDAKAVIANNPNADMDKIQLPFEVFTNFCFAENFIARTDRAVKDMSRKWAMPYIIADYLYGKCVGDYMDNRYEQPISGDKRAFNLEIYWNCVLYGYNLCFNELSMDENTFLQNVVARDGVLTWTKASVETTKMFQDDPLSAKLKAMVENKIAAGGQIQPVVHFNPDFGSDSVNRFANQQLLCLRGSDSIYFVFIEGEYQNVILKEQGGKIPAISLKDPKQLAFFKKLSSANRVGYSSPELKEAVEGIL